MRTLLWGLLVAAAAGRTAWAQENIFIANSAAGTVTVVDAQTLAPLPLSSASPNPGPNPIAVGANPTACLYDPQRGLVYVVNSGPGTISVIDPRTFTVTATIQMPDAANLAGASITPDGRFLFTCGFENIPKRAAVFQLDLDNLTNAGAALVAGLTQGDGRNPSDMEVLSDRVYMIVQSQLYEIDFPIPAPPSPPPPGYPVMTLVPPVTGTNPPSGPTRMMRSPDGGFILLTSLSNNAVGSAWQVIRLTPLPQTPTLPNTQLDFFTLSNTGNAGNSIDDVLFLRTGGGSPFAAAILGRDDAGPKVVRFSIGATGGASGAVIDSGINSQWGGGFTYDLAGNRYFVNGSASTSVPNDFYVDDPASPPPVQVASGGSGPAGFAFAPQPPPMSINTLTEPAGVTQPGSFMIEIHGGGFIPGSSRARIMPNTFATTTTVVNSGVILATFATTAPVMLSIGVLNNDGQANSLTNFFEGMPQNPVATPFTVALPPLTSGYSMLSFPQYATVGDLRSAIASQWGSYNPILFRMFLWQGSRYFELSDPNLPSSLSIMGTGFMGLSRQGQNLTLQAPDVAGNTPGALRAVVLAPGWNMVSLPWPSGTFRSMFYANLQVHQLSDLSDPAQNPTLSLLVSNAIYEVSANVYVTSTLLSVGKAYWMLNQTSGPLYLQFDQTQVNQFKQIAAPKSASAAQPPPLPGASLDDSAGGAGGAGGCGLLGGEALLVLLFLRGLGRRRLAA